MMRDYGTSGVARTVQKHASVERFEGWPCNSGALWQGYGDCIPPAPTGVA